MIGSLIVIGKQKIANGVKMQINATLNNDIYSLQKSIEQENENKTISSDKKNLKNKYVVNDLKNIYVDPVKINELYLKEVNTPESIKNSNRLKKGAAENINFKKESYFFKKENVQNVPGDLRTAQANINSTQIASKLLN